MDVSLAWLRDLAPGLEGSAEAIGERLALRGSPVEAITHLAAGLEDVIVGRVEEAGRHPNADRLSLCRVNDGTGIRQVVCGAPNVRAGASYPFAPVGSTLPGGLTLRKARIRGEDSEGMLCSASELGLGTDHDGILELPGSPDPGTRLVDILGLEDVRLDVEVTSNRPDLLSHLGIAREVAPGGEGSLLLPDFPDAASPSFTPVRGAGPVSSDGVSVRVDAPELCPRYLGAVIRGVRVGPSPAWLQNRLRAAGARPINNVVDATNYVLLELGQPLHAFDLDTLAGREIVVRRAHAGERLTTLDGVERTLTADMLAICDAERAVAVAGVMGGLETEVTDGTTTVLLECAQFSPPSVRSTRQALGMSTDASYRFERGVDPAGLERALERCAALIRTVAGGEDEVSVLDAHPRPWSPATVPLRLSRIERVLGVEFDEDSTRSLLVPLGFQVEDVTDGTLHVRVPGYRSWDVRREVDLIEEVARTHGYDRFPADLRGFRPSTVPDHPLFELEDRLRRALVARGMVELQTTPFTSEGEVELPNPVSGEDRYLRPSLLATVLGRVDYNLSRGQRDLMVFEMANVFRSPTETGGLPMEEARLAAVITGARTPPHWSTPAEDCDLWDLKGWFAWLAAEVWPGAEIVPCDGDGHRDLTHHLNAVYVAEIDGRILGVAGQIQDTSLEAPAWGGPLWGLEMILPARPEAAPTPEYRPLPAYPGTSRDLSLRVPAGITAEQVAEVVRGAAGSLLEDLRLLDVYEGAEVGTDARSLTWRMDFRSREGTLTDADVDPQVARVVARLREALGVEQRGGAA